MTSLAVESNYSNMTAARGRRRIVIRNPDNTTTITHTTATAYNNGFTVNNSNNTPSNSSMNNNRNLATFNGNMNENTNGNNLGSNSSLNNINNNKMSPTNIIYNLKSGAGAGEGATFHNNEPRLVEI